jgi:hypothetical protein
MDLSFCSCSFKLNTAKHSSKRGQADKRLTSLRRGLFVLVVLNGHLAVTELEISIERFRLFIFQENEEIVFANCNVSTDIKCVCTEN